MKQITDLELKLFQATSIIALAFSVLFQYLIIKAFLSQDTFTILLDFNAAGEGFLEMLIVFPVCILISGITYYNAYKLGQK